MTKIKKYSFIFLFAFFILLPAISSAADFDYKVMESIPGTSISKEGVYSFNDYVSSIYNFGIVTVAIAALLMLSIGAFMYLTSAGNNAAMGSAKGVITDALIGLILALFSYLLLYIINPDLVKLKGIIGGGKTPPTTTTPGPSPGPTYSSVMQKVCTSPPNKTAIDYSKAASDASVRTTTRCKNTSFTNSNGIDENLLRAISQVESGCGSTNATSSHGACGIMQILPKTAKSLDASLKSKTDAEVCAILKSDQTKSIDLASLYIQKNQSGLSTQDIIAGYNGGYGTKPSSSTSGKDPPLMPSKDCGGGLKAYQCCINPGGLVENITYTYNVSGLYAKYTNGQ